MSELPLYGPIFGSARPLPRGPHGLPREEVVSSQRARLLAAIVDVVAEDGYAGATIAEIGRRAGVSPRTFYEHFDDKLTCFLAAYDTFSGTLLERIGQQIAGAGPLDELAHGALAAYLVSLRDNPRAARAFLCEMPSAGARARLRRRETNVRLAAGLRELHRSRRPAAAPAPLSDAGYRAILHGVREVACDLVESDDAADPTDLLPDLRQWVAATLAGADADADADAG